ncbi:MAG TPA: hypothetical protein VF677_00130 [Flavobacterium sp.]|jgi:hypothetical protein
MKKYVILLFAFITFLSHGQSLNNFKYLIVPVQFDFQSQANLYRLNSNAKFNLTKYGFTTLFSNDTLPVDLAKDKCKAMYFDVVKTRGFLTTKLYVVIKDCQNKVLFKSPEGSSKEKVFEKAYNEALTEALASLRQLNYKYITSDANDKPVAATEAVVPIQPIPVGSKSQISQSSEEILFAQPIPNGFQLVNNEPKIILKIFKTSVQDIYLAIKGNLQGVVIKKGNGYFFESYQNNALISERIEVKF